MKHDNTLISQKKIDHSINRMQLSEIQNTLGMLFQRIKERFPNSGLLEVCGRLFDLSHETNSIINWIFKPHYGLYILIVLFLIASSMLFLFSLTRLKIAVGKFTIPDLVQTIEAGTNWILVIGAGIFFLINFDTRQKRKRIIKRINILISFAHIIDAHQLTKSPDRFMTIKIETPSSPKEEFTPYTLGRYLDYCTEMLSLVAKLGFIYVQDFNDHVASDANNDLENLTSGISQKIWQKIMILKTHKE